MTLVFTATRKFAQCSRFDVENSANTQLYYIISVFAKLQKLLKTLKE